LMFVESQKVHI